MRFEWDVNKAHANLRKHSVDFNEAQSVFLDELSRVIADMLHDDAEDRWIILGMSNRQRLLVVVFTEYADAIRLISARLASRRERLFYEDEES